MFKLLMISQMIAREAPSLHSVIAEFETKEQADLAYSKALESNDSLEYVSIKVIKLY